jgi:hypothetical protein
LQLYAAITEAEKLKSEVGKRDFFKVKEVVDIVAQMNFGRDEMD